MWIAPSVAELEAPKGGYPPKATIAVLSAVRVNSNANFTLFLAKTYRNCLKWQIVMNYYKK